MPGEWTVEQIGDAGLTPEIAAAWQRLLHVSARGVEGPDLTASMLWGESLLATRLEGRQSLLLVARQGDQIAGLLPLVFDTSRRGMGATRLLEPLQSLYGGRMGLLVDPRAPQALRHMLSHLREARLPWDALILTTLEGSADAQLVQQEARTCGLGVLTGRRQSSPYVPLGTSWEALFEGLQKKHRYTIRSGERRLREQGALEYRELSRPEDVEELTRCMSHVEKGSWKDAAASSIARNPGQQRFYDHFLPRAAASAVLSGHVLLLDGMPIAYMLGLIDGCVFLDLKESFDAAFEKSSPAHVLKRFVMSSLIARGITVYDFMGECEEYKLKWTDRTYTNVSVTLFRPTIRGRVAKWRSLLSRVRNRSK